MKQRIFWTWACCALLFQPAWAQDKKPRPTAVQAEVALADDEKKTKEKAQVVRLSSDLFVKEVDILLDVSNQDVVKWTGAYGINVAPVEPAMQEQLQLKQKDGLLVIGLNDVAQAAKADLKLHDIILGLGKNPDPTKPAPVVILRKGKSISKTLPAVTPAKQFWLGIQSAAVEEPLRTQLSLPEGKGLLLTEVIDKTPAKQSGLQAYDVIIGTDHADITKVEDLAALVQQSAGKPMSIRLIRHAKPLTLTITPVQRPGEDATTADNTAKQALYLLARDQTANTLMAQRVFDQHQRQAYYDVYSKYLNNTTTTATKVDQLQEELAKMVEAANAMQAQLKVLNERLKQKNAEKK